MDQIELSIVIPTLNEEAWLERLLDELALQEQVVTEVIIADGGSVDRTCAIAERFGSVVRTSPAGRARQMNVAATHAQSATLLFLHADSSIDDPLLLRKALDALDAEIKARASNDVAGHFSLCFGTEECSTGVGRPVRPRALKYYERKTALNRPNTTNGDQGFLLRTDYFKRLGGFDESLSFLEDQTLAERIREDGLWITLPGSVTTSTRRFDQEGMARRMILSAIVMGLYSTEFEPFFRRAQEVYRQNAHCRRLRLAPYFALIHRLVKERGLRRGARDWLAVGGYVKQNAWQLFFLLDVLCEPIIAGGTRSVRRPFLRTYDVVVEPLLSLRIFDVPAALLTLTWFYLSWAYFTLRDEAGRRELSPSVVANNEPGGYQ